MQDITHDVNPARTSKLKSPAVRIMGRLLAERKGLFASNLFLRMIKDILPFLSPILLGMIVDLLSGTDRNLLGIELTQDDVRSILIIAAFMAGLAVAKTVVGYVHTIVAAHMGRHVVQAARRDLADAAMRMSLDERRGFNSGDLLDRCLADSKGLRSFTQNVIIRMISNTVRAIFPLWYMFRLDAWMALVVLAVIPVQSGVSAILQRRLQRQTREARSREATHTSAVKEAIDGWNNVASVGGQDWAAKGIHETAAASEDAKIEKKHTTASISAVISICTAFGIAAVYAIGGWRIIESGALSGGVVAAGALSLGDLTAFVGVAKKTYAPFQAYTKIVSSYRTGLVNLERIADVLDAPMIDPRENGPDLHVTNGDIALDHVGFTYAGVDTPTLKDLTGVIPGKSLTVITGSSGAGKTTFLRLLLGLDVPGTGTVSIDGQDINVAKFTSLQEAVALVPQEPVLFTGTMGDNLLLGLEDRSTRQLLEACDRAGLLATVRDLPKGLDTQVGSGAHMLSGGQLRRMAIARALLREPEILLLDEPTTGLDIENSTLVLNTLRHISSHTTVVMVSHRSDPLKASDHHLILSGGGWATSDEHQPEAKFGVEPIPNSNGSGSTKSLRAASPAADASTNGHRELATSIGAVGSNGHRSVGRRVLALSAMGRAINYTGIDHDQATTRVMVVSGHRALSQPVAAISSGIYEQVIADARTTVAIASIEDINPDGEFSDRRETVLGVDVASDHHAQSAVETRVLRRALADWRTDLLIDVAEQVTGSAHDAEITLRFEPTADGEPPASVLAHAQEIRSQLDQTSFVYRVSLQASVHGSAAADPTLTVIEVTARNTATKQAINAIATAVTASYRATDTTRRISV